MIEKEKQQPFPKLHGVSPVFTASRRIALKLIPPQVWNGPQGEPQSCSRCPGPFMMSQRAPIEDFTRLCRGFFRTHWGHSDRQDLLLVAAFCRRVCFKLVIKKSVLLNQLNVFVSVCVQTYIIEQKKVLLFFLFGAGGRFCSWNLNGERLQTCSEG